jgi:hypothetical protein
MKSSVAVRRLIGLLLVVAIAGGVCLLIFAFAPISLGRLGLVDFQVYWAGARVLVQGGNPYDRAALTVAYYNGQPPAWTFDPAWNPPWLLLMLAPLAALPVEAAGRIWLLINFAIVAGVPFVVWQLVEASQKRRASPWLVLAGLAFGSSLTVLAMGQVTTWVLVGLLLALIGLKRRHDGWAGAALLLTLSKPQLVYLAVPLILLWAAGQRRWRVWAGLVIAFALTTACVTILTPGWLSGYWNLTSGFNFFRHSAATVGGFFQAYTGSSVLRFLGVLTLLLIPWLLRLIKRRDLLTGLNVALLMSVPLAPYGWSFDQVVLLPAIVQLVFWLTEVERSPRRVCGLILIAIYLMDVGLKILGTGDFWFVWVPIALGGLFAVAYRLQFNSRSSPAPT